MAWDPYGLIGATLDLGGSRTVADQWSQDPIKDPARLRAMQCAYRWAAGDPAVGCPECAEALKYFQIDDDLARITPGWFGTGGRKDVPKQACYVGRCGDVYVWVTPEGIDGLTRFTLVILDIATVDIEDLEPPASPTQEVQKLEYKDGQLVRTVTYTEARKDPEVQPATVPAPAFRPKRRRPERLTPGGLMFTPGTNVNPLRIR